MNAGTDFIKRSKFLVTVGAIIAAHLGESLKIPQATVQAECTIGTVQNIWNADADGIYV